MALYLTELADGAALAPVDLDSPREAVAWFRARAPISRDAWDALDERARRRAFTLAGAAGLDIVTEAWRAVDRAVATGSNFTDFKREVRAQLARSWANTDGRLNVVFRNGVQSAYAAGRYAQATEPDVLAERPFWRFEAILDSRTTPICQPLDGTIRPASDPWWHTHYPPLHHQCRSGVTTLTRERAARDGGTSDLPTDGDAPQRGWGLAPGAGEWEPDLAGYPAELRAAYTAWRAAGDTDR